MVGYAFLTLFCALCKAQSVKSQGHCILFCIALCTLRKCAKMVVFCVAGLCRGLACVASCVGGCVAGWLSRLLCRQSRPVARGPWSLRGLRGFAFAKANKANKGYNTNPLRKTPTPSVFLCAKHLRLAQSPCAKRLRLAYPRHIYNN